MKKIVINVEGMSCTGCENRIKRALATLACVKEVLADHKTGIVTITLNEEIDISIIQEKIVEIGFAVKDLES